MLRLKKVAAEKEIVMTAKNAVADDQDWKTLPTLEQRDQYLRREHELRDRFLKGVRKPEGVLNGLQALINRDFAGDAGQRLMLLAAKVIPAMGECIVARCFVNKGDVKTFAWRDPDFDVLLPERIGPVGKITVRGSELLETLTEAELLASVRTLQSPLQIEDLILRTEAGEDTGLRTDGYANLFFLELVNSVFTVYAYRLADGWSVHVYPFHPGCQWNAGPRVFSGNC